MVVTAGDLIRRELSSGASELGLAKRLAGSKKDSDPEVRRWRYVVRRARKGSEPDDGNVTRIVELLADHDETIERRARGQHQLDRLEALAVEVRRLEDSHVQIHEKLDQLLDAVQDGFRRRAAPPTQKARPG